MPKKKKMSREEIRKEIDRQVAEKRKVWIEERRYESEKLARSSEEFELEVQLSERI